MGATYYWQWLYFDVTCFHQPGDPNPPDCGLPDGTRCNPHLTGRCLGPVHSFTVAATAPPPRPDFGIAVTPATATVTAGRSASYAVLLGRIDGFGDPVELRISGLPPGATGVFATPTAASTQLTISTSKSVAKGAYTFTVEGKSGALAHSTTAALTVTPPPPDRQPPTIGALASSGRARGTARIAFSVKDDSGTASVVATIARGTRTLARLQAARVAASGGTSFLTWKATPKRETLRFCVQATDAAGNRSAMSRPRCDCVSGRSRPAAAARRCRASRLRGGSCPW